MARSGEAFEAFRLWWFFSTYWACPAAGVGALRRGYERVGWLTLTAWGNRRGLLRQLRLTYGPAPRQTGRFK